MIVRRPLLPAVVAAMLGIAACAPKSPPPDAAAPAETPGPGASSAADGAAMPAADTAATLVAHSWRLEAATDAAGQSIAALFPPDTVLGLSFADGRVNVTGGCNRLGAGYRLADTATLEVGQAASTMMACPPPLDAADAAIAAFLRGTLQVAVAGEAGEPQLRLVASDGTALAFSGTPTPETRFGGPGQRAFLEVSPAPCAAPAPASPPCLMVRDRFFDEQGLASAPPGEWRALPEGIEGYTPLEGHWQVVRVKRFERAAAAGGEPEVHHVLDLVVESRTAE